MIESQAELHSLAWAASEGEFLVSVVEGDGPNGRPLVFCSPGIEGNFEKLWEYPERVQRDPRMQALVRVPQGFLLTYRESKLAGRQPALSLQRGDIRVVEFSTSPARPAGE